LKLPDINILPESKQNYRHRGKTSDRHKPTLTPSPKSLAVVAEASDSMRGQGDNRRESLGDCKKRAGIESCLLPINLKGGGEMSVTILEALQNAEMNLVTPVYGIKVASEQLHNAIGLLERGYDINTEVEPLLEEYGDVENVPELPEFLDQ